MSWDTRKIVACTLLLTFSGAAIGTGCPAVIDPVWQEGMVAAKSTITAAIESAQQEISAASSYNLQRIQSALRVVTKQIYVSAEKDTMTDTEVKQAISAAAIGVSNRKAVFNAVMDFNPATGQGVDPCGEIKRSQSVAVAMGEANADMQEKVLREVDNAPGSFVTDQGSVLSKRLSNAKESYCTADEVKAGVCGKVGPFAGRDVDAANFFTSARTGSGESDGKSALLNNMYGVPYVAPSADVINSGSGKSFVAAKRTEDAYRSVSQASMKTIQSWTESRGTGSNPEPSVLDALTKKVDVYAGGDNYDNWEKGQASQSERGLLVEYAKMVAAELYLKHTQYQQMTRIEANMAALLALRSKGSNSVDPASANARNAAAQGKVK